MNRRHDESTSSGPVCRSELASDKSSYPLPFTLYLLQIGASICAA